VNFRDEIRAFLASQRVQDAVTEMRALPPAAETGRLEVYSWLGERGWLAPHWPEQYGGLGLGPGDAAALTEEMLYAGVPDDLHTLSIGIVGTFLLHSGTEAQKREHLPALANGTRMATVLFTEPSCGSDLAALQTEARQDGSGWRLYGTKIYNQKSQFADMALCAARTRSSGVGMDGITLFLVPLKSAGVHVSVVPSMGNDRFTQVVIDGLLLTEDAVVGELHDGWTLMNSLLLLERTGIDFHAKARVLLDTVIRRARAAGRLSPELAELDARLAAAHALAWQQVHNLAEDRPSPGGSAMAKWYASEHFRPILRAAAEIDGLDSVLTSWDAAAPADGTIESAYRTGPSLRLASGTSEVMLYLIATGELGLL
jgi:alkylation response protein AidB-like acyl-CoA dehydrogenase